MLPSNTKQVRQKIIHIPDQQNHSAQYQNSQPKTGPVAQCPAQSVGRPAHFLDLNTLPVVALLAVSVFTPATRFSFKLPLLPVLPPPPLFSPLASDAAAAVAALAFELFVPLMPDVCVPAVSVDDRVETRDVGLELVVLVGAATLRARVAPLEDTLTGEACRVGDL